MFVCFGGVIGVVYKSLKSFNGDLGRVSRFNHKKLSESFTKA